MPAIIPHTVKDTLTHSKASAERLCQLNQHFGLALWTNQHDQVTYHQTNHHTLSLYIEGGYSTRRTDLPTNSAGAPNRFCILPAGQESRWEVGERQRFAHIYFSDDIFKHLALEGFDIDPRTVELPDKTFFDEPQLLTQMQSLLSHNWETPDQYLALQEQVWEILGDILLKHALKPLLKSHYRGGLTKVVLAKILDYINAHINQQISIESMAYLANLSPFHFVRMYKISTGVTPHQHIMMLRINKARQLLLNNQSQTIIVAACGFANQSHFSREFRKHYGITPRQFMHLYKS
jgi:AraC family transcriptional regulator